MESDKILKLVEAGFTADEIRKMLTPASETVTIVQPESPSVPLSAEQDAAGSPGPAAAAAPSEEKPDVLDVVKAAVTEQMSTVMKQYEETMNKMAKLAGMPSVENVQPKGIEDIISGFFKEE